MTKNVHKHHHYSINRKTWHYKQIGQNLSLPFESKIQSSAHSSCSQRPHAHSIQSFPVRSSEYKMLQTQHIIISVNFRVITFHLGELTHSFFGGIRMSVASFETFLFPAPFAFSFLLSAASFTLFAFVSAFLCRSSVFRFCSSSLSVFFRSFSSSASFFFHSFSSTCAKASALVSKRA
jgi:hypothetical protein